MAPAELAASRAGRVPHPAIVDVREPWEFERCRREGSRLVPLRELTAPLRGCSSSSAITAGAARRPPSGFRATGSPACATSRAASTRGRARSTRRCRGIESSPTRRTWSHRHVSHSPPSRCRLSVLRRARPRTSCRSIAKRQKRDPRSPRRARSGKRPRSACTARAGAAVPRCPRRRTPTRTTTTRSSTPRRRSTFRRTTASATSCSPRPRCCVRRTSWRSNARRASRSRSPTSRWRSRSRTSSSAPRSLARRAPRRIQRRARPAAEDRGARAARSGQSATSRWARRPSPTPTYNQEAEIQANDNDLDRRRTALMSIIGRGAEGRPLRARAPLNNVVVRALRENLSVGRLAQSNYEMASLEVDRARAGHLRRSMRWRARHSRRTAARRPATSEAELRLG